MILFGDPEHFPHGLHVSSCLLPTHILLEGGQGIPFFHDCTRMFNLAVFLIETPSAFIKKPLLGLPTPHAIDVFAVTVDELRSELVLEPS